MLVTTATLEFVCAQAPYSMKGLLIGTNYSIIGLGSLLGVILFIIWYFAWRDDAVTTPDCGFWYFLFTSGLTLVFLVVFCVVARWYRRREREEPHNEQKLVEDAYSKYCTSIY